jgi:hypothetical protein
MKLPAAAVAACLLLPVVANAQPAPRLVEDYARVVAILNGTTAFVGGTLLACTTAGVLSEPEAEQRFKSYRNRNTELEARVDEWSRQAQDRLRAQGDERAARERVNEAALSAIAGSTDQAEREIAAAPDRRAECAARLVAIDSGVFDLARNPELAGLLAR